MLKDSFTLALKSLRHRGIRSWLTMLGIFIGIAAVVSLISLGQGLQTAITGQFSTLDPDKLMVQSASAGFGPPGSMAVRKLNEHDIKVIERVSGVDQVVSRLIRNAKVDYNKQTAYFYLASLPEDQTALDIIYDSLNVGMQEGNLLELEDRGKVVLGNALVNENNFGKPIRVGTNIVIQGKSFEVAGILKAASSFQINNVILMPEKDMKDILGIGDEIDIIVVQVEDQDRIEEVSASITRALRNDRNLKEGEEDFSVQTPLQSLNAINTILNMINLVVSGIAGISLLVGGIGIANTMYTSVLERTREIGIMKAVGAQNKDILSIFLIESGLLGLVGGIVGALIGIGLAYAVAGIANGFFGDELILVQVSWLLLLGSIAFSFFLGLISGIFPAFQASRLSPVEALRK